MDTTNKPVAWMDKTEGILSFDYMGAGFIPLYTSPRTHDLGIADAIGFERGYKAATQKELTDEEIIAVGNAVVNHIDSNEGWIEFARAILRKAQEK